MSTYTVTISQRPLGVRFCHLNNNKNQMVLSLRSVYHGTHAFELGLCAGDTLISIENETIEDLPPFSALELFRNQPLPFKASFISPEDSDSESSLDSQDALNAALWVKYINNSPVNNTPSSQRQQSLIYSDVDDCYLSDTSSDSTSYNSDNDSTSDIPSDCDSASECSISFNSFQQNFDCSTNTNLTPVKSVNFTYQFSPKPISKLMVPNLNPKPSKIHLPLPQSMSNSVAMDTGCELQSISIYNPWPFVNLNTLLNNQTPQLYQQYMHIDTDTKNLVNGFLWNICKIMPTDDKIKVLTAKYLWNNTVLFDKKSVNFSQDNNDDYMKVCMLSNNGFYYGVHKWTIRINKCDVYRQEIGVVSNCDNFDNIIVEKGGIGETNAFGAKAIYGNELFTNDMYYGSYNDNGMIRCEKDIYAKIGWCAKDEIKVILNLKHGNIQFFLNDRKVRKTISLQKGKKYYPIISFSGNCQYELIHFE